MTKWEYKMTSWFVDNTVGITVDQYRDQEVKKFNALGLEGWQLVQVIPSATGVVSFWKRPLE